MTHQSGQVLRNYRPTLDVWLAVVEGPLSKSNVIDSQWVWRSVILPSGRYSVKSGDSYTYCKGGVVKGVEGSRR